MHMRPIDLHPGAAKRSGRGPVIALMLVTITCAQATVAQQTQTETARNGEMDAIVAIVNDDVIVSSELDNRLRMVLSQLRGSGTQPPSLDALRKQVLERLVIDRLQIQIANRNGIRIEETELNRAIGEIAQRNELSMAQFREILERDGFNFTGFREEIRNELLIAQIRQRVVQDRVRVAEREIDNFLANEKTQRGSARELRLSEILVAIPADASRAQVTQANQHAQSLFEQLRNGADFAELAVASSNGQTALKGGDIGWRHRFELPPLFARAVDGLAPGEVSDVTRSPVGFHILKVVDVREETQLMVTQTRARHIMLRPTELTPENEVRDKLAQLKVRSENNEDFAALARAHSEDSKTASAGGDLGWLSPGALGPEFDRALGELAAGQISAPFQTRSGWHIVQAMERRDRDGTREAHRARASEQIRKRKVDEEFQTWLRQIRDEAYVEVRLQSEQE